MSGKNWWSSTERGQTAIYPYWKLTAHDNRISTICYELLSPFGFSSAQVPHVLSLMVCRQRALCFFANAPHYQEPGFPDNYHHCQRDTADFILIDECATQLMDTGKFRYNFSIENKPKVIPADANIGCFNMEGIEFPLILRRWRVGDYFYPFGMKMKKKVSRLLIERRKGATA